MIHPCHFGTGTVGRHLDLVPTEAEEPRGLHVP